MASALAGIKQEWRQFRDDPPGERFRNHNERMRSKSRALVVAQFLLGVVLLVVGIALLFIPGPGTVVMAFGLGVLAGRSKKLAGVLDRAEPVVRRWVEIGQRRWYWLPRPARYAILVVGLAAAVFAAYVAWRWLT
jgi:hypothetical protein